MVLAAFQPASHTGVHSASMAWRGRLAELIRNGDPVQPRGQPTWELIQATLGVNMRYPAIVCPERGLNYRFMAAEALWIITGDDRAKTIVPYNRNIAQFSDDGERFFGAYGPHVVKQLPHVLRSLGEDQDTRQAWLRIWQDNPPPTKDTPCTIALGWSVRGGALHCHAYMRSSDVWLGVPYDIFNFSLVSMYVRHQLGLLYGGDVDLGNLYLTAASSHLYERDAEAAERVLTDGRFFECPPVPDNFGAVLHSLRCRMELDDLDAAWRFWEAD